MHCRRMGLGTKPVVIMAWLGLSRSILHSLVRYFSSQNHRECVSHSRRSIYCKVKWAVIRTHETDGNYRELSLKEEHLPFLNELRDCFVPPKTSIPLSLTPSGGDKSSYWKEKAQRRVLLLHAFHSLFFVFFPGILITFHPLPPPSLLSKK